jgi:LPXTG-motif cell wall-anchored protein
VVLSWRHYGHEFVYPKVKAQELATANHQAVASMPQEMEANTTQPAATMEAPPVVALKQAPLTAQTETEEPAEIAQVFPPPPADNAQTLPEQLPQTASDLPLIGLLGLASLTSAFLLRRIRVR